MNWRTAVGMLCVALLMSGCVTHSGPKADPLVPPGAPKGLVEMTPTQSAEFGPVVNRYFYYRKRAVVAQDVETLYREYPDLRTGTDKQAGINAESDLVAVYRGLQVIDGNIDPRHYAQLMVRGDGDKAIVLVNGLEMYVTSAFGESGGQIQVLLFFERHGGVWTVVKTDETTLAEFHQSHH